MSTFLRPVKKNLKNAQHYSLMEAFKTVYGEAGFTGAKLTGLFTAFTNAFAVEDRYYMQAKASDVIARRNAADLLRDKLYTKLYALVRVWLDSGNPSMEAAAEALEKVFKLYAVKTSAQIDEETGQLDNLIADLSAQAMTAHIETLGGTWLFQQMKAAHTEVKTIRLEQGTEESQKVAGALLAARRASDEAYDALITALEAYAVIADDPAPYEAFIRTWNGTLKLYQDMLNRKNGTTTAGNANEGGSTSDSENGGGSSNSENTGNSGSSGSGSGDSENNENSGSGSSTPTTPTEPVVGEGDEG